MTEKLDEDFTQLISEVTSGYSKFTKHLHIRIEQWVQKLQQSVTNTVWKKHRNEYALVLADMVRNHALREPFVRVPPEGPLPKLSRIDFPILTAARPRSKSPLSETQALRPSNRTISPHKTTQPRSPSFGRDADIVARGQEIMEKHFIHPLGGSKKRSASLLPTVDNMTLLIQQLEEARKREEALQETIAAQTNTIREQQATIAALQARLNSVSSVSSQEAQADSNADFVKSIDKFQDEAVIAMQERLKASTKALLAQEKRITAGQEELRSLQKPWLASSPSLAAPQSEDLEETLLRLEQMRRDISKMSAIHYS